MRRNLQFCRRGLMAAVGLATVFVVTGCMSVKPAKLPYTFIQNDATLHRYELEVYTLAKPDPDRMLSVVFSYPTDGFLAFSHGAQLDMKKWTGKMLRLAPGVYPFQILKPVNKAPMLSGALMVYNIDETVGLATIGKKEDNQLFNQDLMDKAASGVLTKYTTKFDQKDVLIYWLGNRKTLYAGGLPTAEVDFSANAGITELKVDGRRIEGFVAVLDICRMESLPNGGKRSVPQEYKIELSCGGRKYRGYLRNLKDNDFTAFMRIPCTIPRDLLKAAGEGTVSRFNVRSEAEQKEDVAEIVIGGI